MTTKTLTPKEIALDWGTSGKTLRKFLRQDEKVKALAPGKGGRWAIPANSLKGLKTRFIAWKAAQAAEAAKRREEAEKANSDNATEEVEVPEEDQVIEVLIEDDEDEVPTQH